MQKLQNSMTRLMFVSGLQIAPAPDTASAASTSTSTANQLNGDHLTTTITGEIFVLPDSATAITGITGGNAVSTTTGSAS